MSDKVSIHDPDDWINWWKRFHRSDLFYGELAYLALDKLTADVMPDGPSIAMLRFSESGEDFEVEVRYLLEDFPRGRVFHVLSIRSEGDPLPPLSD